MSGDRLVDWCRSTSRCDGCGAYDQLTEPQSQAAFACLLGKLAATKGETSLAKSLFAEAARLDPDDVLYRRELERLSLPDGWQTRRWRPALARAA